MLRNIPVGLDRLEPALSPLSRIPAAVAAVGETFASTREARMLRTSLDPDDFTALHEAGFTRFAVPEAKGGAWRGVAESVPVIAKTVRQLAQGDPNVALVASMHPAVVGFWLGAKDAHPELFDAAQSGWVFESVIESGSWWGTMISEPGSGGDIFKTRCEAQALGEGKYALTGAKHFGSGSGVTDYMITTALPADTADAVPTVYIIDMRDRAWDGTTGLSLLREWDGYGMCATQSHAFSLERCEAIEMAVGVDPRRAMSLVGQIGAPLFVAVTLGVLDQAYAFAVNALTGKRDSLRSYERVELTAAANEYWQADALFHHMCAKIGRPGGAAAVGHGKLAVSQLAESLTSRLCKVLGGAGYSKGAPLGRWAQDVRALGFLRPPWPLQYDQQFERIWKDPLPL